MDSGLNSLLQWSLANTGAPNPEAAHSSASAPASTSSASAPARPLNAEALKVLMGGPSDAELMRSSMAAIHAPDVALADKMVAFDNLEQLIENIDNANNMQPLGLWTPLVGLLRSEEAGLRRMAAWCVGTAVQNNAVAQERLLVLGAIPTLVALALHDADEPVRRKAIYALSSELRNYQPALDAVVAVLPPDVLPGSAGQAGHAGDAGVAGKAGHAGENVGKGIDAGDMDAVDGIVEALRRKSGLKRGDGEAVAQA